MSGYYNEKLSAEKLKQCYDAADERIRQYLTAEINFVISHLKPNDIVLELGCGFGRVIKQLQPHCRLTIGIDTAFSSLKLAQESGQLIALMDASNQGFRDNSFDHVICIQNGLSAFQVDRLQLIEESLRITKPGGLVLFSTYAEKFWPHRLRWFEEQSHRGLLGEIDYDKTGDGVIICKDGFRSDTISPNEFNSLASQCDCSFELEEVDQSSLFCILTKNS
ncbi:MAG: class I SAM-dependent methyltransferase [candidate division Zixibacteria bacterium]|nr:class I SAM-dependent methyltransferase [candidate division Zixibacteria bacterium]